MSAVLGIYLQRMTDNGIRSNTYEGDSLESSRANSTTTTPSASRAASRATSPVRMPKDGISAFD